MTIKSIVDRDAERSGERVDGPADDVVDRLAELLPADALEDALKGLSPEEITGPAAS